MKTQLPAGLPVLLTEDQAAAFLQVSVPFLRKDRITKRSIPYAVIGARMLRYPVDALQKYVAARMEGGVSHV